MDVGRPNRLTGSGYGENKNIIRVVPEGAAAEKEVLGTAIRQSYAELFQRNLETITPAQLAEAIGKYGPTGSTRDRAVRFFLKVAGYCGVKISGRLTERKPRGPKPIGREQPQSDAFVRLPRKTLREWQRAASRTHFKNSRKARHGIRGAAA